jgi:hypothetical protein
MQFIAAEGEKARQGGASELLALISQKRSCLLQQREAASNFALGLLNV